MTQAAAYRFACDVSFRQFALHRLKRSCLSCTALGTRRANLRVAVFSIVTDVRKTISKIRCVGTDYVPGQSLRCLWCTKWHHISQEVILSCSMLPYLVFGSQRGVTVLILSFGLRPRVGSCVGFFNGWTPLVVLGLLIVEVSRSHSVGLLWTSDQPDAETSTWQHTTFTRDQHPCPQRDSNPQSQQANGRRPTS